MPKAWNISRSQREDNLCRQFCELCLQSTGQCAVKTNQLTVIENGIQIPFKCGAENGSNVSNWAKRREHLTTSATFAAALSQRSQMEGGDEPHLRRGGSNRQEAYGDGTNLRDIEAITSREEAASAVVVASQDGGACDCILAASHSTWRWSVSSRAWRVGTVGEFEAAPGLR